MLDTFTRNEIGRVLAPSAATKVKGSLDLVDGPGNTFFVHSGGSTSGSGLVWNDPVSTLEAAVQFCAANNGDVIYIKPGHAETLSADSAVDIDIAGITVIGLGTGAARPTFTFDTGVATR